jgi:uroporphyrinogen-III decarboxylase
VEERRVFNETSYSYAIEEYLLQRVEDFPVVIEAMESAYAEPRWERYHAWDQALGRYAYIYAQLPYSGLGYLISRNFGVEQTVYAFYDHPAETKALVDAVNQCNLRILETIIDGPFETLIISDNFDSNIQTRELFNALSRDYYAEVSRRLHEAGKFLAVHVDGEMRGALSLMAEVGVDCVDAATPAPMFSLTPAEARAEAGPDLILSGGIPPTVFGSGGSDEAFERAVRSWLETRLESPRLFLAAGDQVPPDAPWSRVMRLAELVDEYGRYD